MNKVKEFLLNYMTIGRCQEALRKMYNQFPDEESFIQNATKSNVNEMISLFNRIISAKRNIGDDYTEELEIVNDLMKYEHVNLTSPKLAGHLEATYKDGYLVQIKIDVSSRLSEFQFDHFFRLIPYGENNVEKFATLGLTVEKLVELPANKKVAMFCELYFKHNGVKYSASRQDGGKIRGIRIDGPMLDHYFTSQNFLFRGKHSIANLVKYYNELKLEIAQKGKPKHPNHFDQDYVNKLDMSQLSDYWAHLRGVGLQPVKDRFGNITDWIKI